MPTASIRSTIPSKAQITDASRDDLAISDLVTVLSVNVGTAYQWSIAFKPDNPITGTPSTAVFSSTGTESAVTQNPGTFTVDVDGPYLIRLVYTTRQITLNAALSAGVTFSINGVTLTAVAGARTSGNNDFSVASGTIAGITADMVAAINDGANSFSAANLAATDASPSVIISPTVATNPTGETLNITYSGAASDVTITDLVSEQYVRLRALTAFGGLKLVAAGERYDTLRVPVDATASGWADEQNFNLTTLLSLVKTASASGNIFYVDPVEGDYQTIQAAMDAAQAAGPTLTSQWVILVRPSIYEEDLTFYPYVNVFGWPGGETSNLVRIRNNTVASHTIAMAGVGFNLTLCNLYFEQPTVSVNPTILQTGTGTVRMIRCEIEAQGNTGESYSTTGPIELQDCRIVGNGVNVTDYAFRAVGTNAVVAMNRCTITGQSGLFIGDLAQLTMRDCEVTVTGTYAINTVGAVNRIEYSRFVGGSFGINPTAAGAAGNLAVDARWSELPAISIDGTAVVGSATLSLGSSIHGTVTTAGGATVSASVPADSVFYDNTTSGLTAANVQAALDEIYAYAALVRTLDDAYDGGVAGTGNGRRIIADQGAVEIVDAVAPSDPIPPGNANGNLDVVGAIRIGGVGKPELEVDPNPFGNGPTILMGREIWANDAPYGSTALILGNASGSPTYHNYNLRMGTLFADGGNQVGSVFLRGGDAQAAINAGGIYIQGGTAEDGAGGAGGSIYIAPGETASGADGRVIFVDQSTGTSATLTASGVFSGAAVAGTITLGTEMGASTVTFAGGEDLAATQALFNATGVVTAAGDPIVLTTVSKGPSAEVFFLNADAGVDASLGGFSGQAMAGGSWPSQMAVAVTGPDEITFGVGDPNPMIYDSSIGKLTVPGLIDPTGMIFDEAPQPATGAAKGAIFVGDGSGSTVQNRLYYADQAGTLVDLSAAGSGGGGTLQDAYDAGNIITTSGGADIDFNISPAGNFRVDGNGLVQFGALTPIEQFDLRTNTAIGVTAGTTLNINSVQDATLEVTANDASSRAVTIRAQNSVGDANVVVEADNQVTITAQGDATFDVDADVVADKTLLIRATNAKSGLGGSANVTIESEKVSIITEDLDVSPGATSVPATIRLNRFNVGADSLVQHETGGTQEWAAGVQSGTDYWSVHDPGGTPGGERFSIGAAAPGVIRINEVSGSGFSLPATDGAANQVLQTDGVGNVTWATVASGGGDVTGPASSTDQAIARFDGTTGKVLQDTAAATINAAGRLDCDQVFTVGSVNSGGSINATTSITAIDSITSTSSYIKGQTVRVMTHATGTIQLGDVLVCTNAATGEAKWAAPAGGDVTGPASATDNALARFDGTTGKLLQNSNATLTTAGNLTLAGNLELVKAAAANSFVLIDRFDATVSSAVIHTTGGSNDWIVGVPGSGSDYTIADGASNGRLSVNSSGNVTVNPGSAGAFTLPNADGGANEYLQTDGAGNVSWAPAGGGGWPTSTGTDVNGIGYEMAELSAANSYIVLKPGSNGPIQTSVTDNAISGGNGRGLHATDWQRFRTSAGHVASGSYSIVAGGRQNLASQTDSTVSGGQANQATADQSTVSGGQLNTASGPQSAIGGGSTNQTGVAASYASIIGGRENSTLSEGSVCMGIRSRTFLSGQMVHASGTFSGTSSGDAQHGRMILRQVTANNKLELNANAGLKALSTSDYLTLDNNTGHVFTLLVIARAEGSPSPQEDAWWSVQGCIVKENNNASTFMIGPALPTAPDGHRGTQSSNWRLFVTANTTDGRLTIEGDTTLGTFTGNVRWVATLQTTQVGV